MSRQEELDGLTRDGKAFMLSWLSAAPSDRQWREALRAARDFEATAYNADEGPSVAVDTNAADVTRLVVGLRRSRPDGVVGASFVRKDGATVGMELRWRVAVQSACALLAAAIVSSDRAGVSTAEWTEHMKKAWRDAALPFGGRREE